MPTPPASRLVLRNAASSPLGRLSLAGYIADSKGLDSMRVLGSYALVYLLEGEGTFRDPTTTLAVRTGDLLLLFPDVPHRYGPAPGQRWNEFFIVFDGAVFNLWRSLGLIDPARPRFHLEPVSYWLKRIEDIAAGQPSGPEPACRLQQLLSDAIEVASHARVAAGETAWLQQARILLAAPGSQQLGLPEIAHRLGTSHETFRKRFTRLAGVSPTRYRLHCTIERACRMLQQPGPTLRQIAQSCGFCDEFHLSRRFKQVMGMAPTEFRRQVGVR